MRESGGVPDVTVVTLARGRDAHLRNLILGLERQTQPPAELIIAVMQPEPFGDLPATRFDIRQIVVTGHDLPLSAARNAAARAARGRNLVFLDVDCIPGPTLLADYAAALDATDTVLMGEVMYLPAGAAAPGWSYAAFEAVCERHSDRRGPPAHGIEACPDYRCFWSLNFALRAATFERSGGFDERYTGYGGEDTDFAKSFTTQGISLAWLNGARAYHQHHPHHMPPVHHLDSVVRNAELFERKWGYRTMGHWLHAFGLLGLIDHTPGQPIRILRDAAGLERDLTAQRDHQPYANTTSVIRRLEAGIGAA